MPKVSSKEDAAVTIARYVAAVTNNDVPDSIREYTKNHILDTLGVCLAGSKLGPGVKQVVDLVTEWGGKPESTIWSYGHKVPSWAAAFANGAMAHALDYDNTCHSALLHPSAPVIPAAFALAERLGGVNGMDFLTAVAVGQDVVTRLGHSISRREIGWKMDWHDTNLFGGFGAAAACAKLLRLNEDQVASAFGINLMTAAGPQVLAYGTDSELRLINDAFPNKCGIMAALMAHKGVRGIRETFEGKAALYDIYFDGDFHRESLLDGLGKEFTAGADVGYKPWPTNGAAHVYIWATLQLVKEHNLKPQDIEKITAVVGDFAKNLFEPIEARRRPRSSNDAIYSIPFNLALVVLNRKISVGDFTPERLKDPRVLEIAARVDSQFNPEFTFSHRVPPGVVAILTKDGKRYERRVDFAYGDAKNPMSREDLVAKFQDGAAHAVRPLSAGSSRRVADMILGLEKVKDVAGVVQATSG